MHAIEDSPGNRMALLEVYLQRLPEQLSAREGLTLPGITPLLDQLAGTVPLGLLTGNVQRGALVKLTHFSLHDYFAFGAYGDHHESRDDVAREAHAFVRERFDHVEPRDIVVIGDTPDDVRCARAIGATAIAVATGHFSMEQLRAAQPDVLLANLADAATFAAICGS